MLRVPSTSYHLTETKWVLGALLLGARGVYNLIMRTHSQCGAARRRLPFFAALWRHRLVNGPKQEPFIQEPDKHHPDRDRAADGAHIAVSAPAGRGSCFA